MANQEEWITVAQAAARFGVTPQTIYTWINENKINALRRETGRGTLVEAHEVERIARPRPLGQEQRRKSITPAIFSPPAPIG